MKGQLDTTEVTEKTHQVSLGITSHVYEAALTVAM